MIKWYIKEKIKNILILIYWNSLKEISTKALVILNTNKYIKFPRIFLLHLHLKNKIFTVYFLISNSMSVYHSMRKSSADDADDEDIIVVDMGRDIVHPAADRSPSHVSFSQRKLSQIHLIRFLLTIMNTLLVVDWIIYRLNSLFYIILNNLVLPARACISCDIAKICAPLKNR